MSGQNDWYRQQRIAKNRAERLATMAEAQRQAEKRNAARAAATAEVQR
ncbi:hypothetical protein AB0L22_09295 [Micromonospora haikouensis]